MPTSEDIARHVDFIRRVIHPSYRDGKNWGGLITAQARASAIIEEQVRLAAKQLHASTASGKYLRHRGADRGIPYPSLLWPSDDVYRKLIISLNHQVTPHALLRLLSIFYGESAVQGVARSAKTDLYPLEDGDTLDILVDEKKVVHVVFRRTDFAEIIKARADEVAAVIIKAMRDANVAARARTYIMPGSSSLGVEILSESVGFTSSIRIIGGTAQPLLQFSEPVFPEVIPPPLPGSWGHWTVQPLGHQRVRWQLDVDTLLPLRKVEVGDYLVVRGAQFDSKNRGSWPIVDVFYSYSGIVLTQWVEVIQPQSIYQLHIPHYEWDNVTIWRPVKHSIANQRYRATVTQVDGTSYIDFPATTKIVQREIGNAAYLAPVTTIQATIARRPDGTATINSTNAHGLSVGQWVFLDDSFPGASTPAITPGTPVVAYNTYGEGNGVSPLAILDRMSIDQVAYGAYSRSLSYDGTVVIVGGTRINPISPTNGVQLYLAPSFTVTPEGLERNTYTWRYEGSSHVKAMGSAITALTDIDKRGQILMAGGYENTVWSGPVSGGNIRNTSSARITLRKYREDLLVVGQLSASNGVLAGLVVSLLAQPTSGNILTISDGTTTRNYGYGGGGDVTVTIGPTIDVTLANLATAINGDASAAWWATYVSSWLYPHGAVVIYEKNVIAPLSGLRAYGTLTPTQSNARLISFAHANGAYKPYTDTSDMTLPTTNPGHGHAGMHRRLVEVALNDHHRLANGEYRYWNGTTWVNDAVHLTSVGTSGNLFTAVAEGALATAGNGDAILAGGVTRYHDVTSQIQKYNHTTDTWSNHGNLVWPRAQASAVTLNNGKVLIIGGRQPWQGPTSQWQFDEPFGATHFAGPPNLPVGTNPRVPGKAGFGVALTNVTGMIASTPDPAFNTVFHGTYTVSIWVTHFVGTLFSLAGTGTNYPNDNTLLAFGVDPADGKFFIRWATYITNAVVTHKTLLAFESIVGPFRPSDYRRFHNIVISSTLDSNNDRVFKLYINGRFVQQFVDLDTTGGNDAVLHIGSAHTVPTTIPGAASMSGYYGYPAVVDELRYSSDEESPKTIWLNYLNGVGITYDSPDAGGLQPVGRVLSSCEIVDPATTNSVITGPMGYARYGAIVVKLPDGRVLAAGGVGWRNDQSVGPPSTGIHDAERTPRELELSSAEIYEPSTGTWHPIASMHEPHAHGVGELVGRRVYVYGGHTSRLVEYLDIDTMRWGIAPVTLPNPRAHGAGGVSQKSVALAGGYVPTPTGLLEQTSDAGIAVGVTANSARSGGLRGLHRVHSVPTSNSLTVVTHKRGWTASSPVTVSVVAASAQNPQIGPYLVDRYGFTISPRPAVTHTAMAGGRGHLILPLQLNQALLFPDEPGYIVVNYGSTMVGPIPYESRHGHSDLKLDASFVWDKSVPAGASVWFVASREAYIPKNPFLLTASSAGRVLLTGYLMDITASGIPMEITVHYPGDRGLGGEARPTEKSRKLSEIVAVHAGDSPDVEVEEARRA